MKALVMTLIIVVTTTQVTGCGQVAKGVTKAVAKAAVKTVQRDSRVLEGPATGEFAEDWTSSQQCKLRSAKCNPAKAGWSQMEMFEHIALVLDGLLIMLALGSIGWGLWHTIGVWLGGLEQDLADDGDSDYGGEADAGGDGSGLDFGGGFDGFLS
jgi:hypothetical protein